MAVSPNSCLSRYLLIFMLLQLPKLDSAYFDVIGPQEPILAVVGTDTQLPCHLSPNMSAEHMELRWFRQTLSPAVFLYQNQQEQVREQMPEYQGRVTLVKDNITTGHAAVRIHGVRASDDGEYRCFFRENESYEEAIVHLKVAGECTEEFSHSLTTMLNLSSYGSLTMETTRFISESFAEGWQNPRCSGELPQERLYHPAPFFPRLTPWIVSVAVVLIVLGLLTIGSIFFIWRLYKERERTSKFSSTEKLLEELKWKKATLHAVDVTLDPDTAHPHLFLYEDSKSVRLEDSRQKLPDKPERFDSWPCVLGRETFTSGSHYWEVEVGDRTDWAIGVCRENVIKKGSDPMTPENGFWAVELYGNRYWALTALRTPLPLAGSPRRVGIFLDYESGDISFYNMTDGSQIYTFPSTSFSGPLRPFFCLWSCGEKPLTICPVANRPEGVIVVANSQDLSKDIPLSPVGEDSASGDTDTLHSKLIPSQSNQGLP
ncbi:PREDICTED: butyrophilin subfamily 1 member A1-like [Dipodomys ordii]|uniref:Butyrophilin subfamily 1 member A1-like n=1 Tax=Dipodomys ordii TaxID=10020 RepID=A0A1S3GP92_DIPOR|nr:PREDICTED: butyrophilin subfamily 1 member A1-like [Dipodomys ordii]